MLGVAIETQNRRTSEWLQNRYAHFGIRDLMPAGGFDWRRDQLIPGRPELIKHIERIKRYAATVTAVLVTTSASRL